MVVLITKDLFFIPTFRSAAEPWNEPVTTASPSDREKLLSLEADEVRVCILDLSSAPVDALPELVASLRGQYPDARLIAFGPHVQTARLAAAQAAGCDEVFSRGQIGNRLSERLGGWLGTAKDR